MSEKEKKSGMLSPYRVLDLTDEKGFLCPRLLGDLGADVIKIERPGGDPSRKIGPYYKDIPDPEKSLYWFAFNANKKGITLNIETAEGQKLFKRLVEKADFVVESFPIGYMDKIGLGYEALNRVNPKVIMASITPFGQSGPYRDYKATDLVLMAMSGALYPSGDPDRPPVRISFPQSYSFAGADAAVALLMALYYRNLTGEGQFVDGSVHWSTIPAQYDTYMWWFASKRVYRRQGAMRIRPQTGVVFRQTWPCKDGFVTFYYFGGLMGAAGNKGLTRWMEAEGFDTGFMKNMNWKTFSWSDITQEDVNFMEEVTGKFFMSHTKQELYNGAVEKGIMLYPVSTAKDMVESRQLAARDYWVKLAHPELDAAINYPGLFVKTPEAGSDHWRRAPLIGEHNEEIYAGELGLSPEEIAGLKQRKII